MVRLKLNLTFFLFTAFHYGRRDGKARIAPIADCLLVYESRVCYNLLAL